MKDYYYLLGVNRDCVKEDIRKSYRSLSKAFHPDKTNNDLFLGERFKEITEAYGILISDEKRAVYDQTLFDYETQGLKSQANAITATRRKPSNTIKGKLSRKFAFVFFVLILLLVPLVIFQYN